MSEKEHIEQLETIAGDRPGVSEIFDEDIAACRWAIDELKALQERAEAAEAMLEKWPRVYWLSVDPKSATEGYRVLSVSGKEGCDCDDSWCDVLVDNPDYDGNPFPAPADFGLYSTPEEAAEAEQ